MARDTEAPPPAAGAGVGVGPAVEAGAAARPAEPARTLIDVGGTVLEGAGRSDIESRLAAATFFWLDLPCLGDEEMTWLRDVFHFHPLAVEDAEHFNQRPKLDEYDGYVYLVLYGSGTSVSTGALDAMASGTPACTPDELERLSEVHCFVSDHYLVTVHRSDCPAFRDLAARMRARVIPGENPSRLFYRVADTLVESFFPVLSELDDRIDILQAQIMQRPTNEQLAQLLQFKSSLINVRRVISPQRDLFAGLSSGVTTLPGFDDDSQRYFRDVYDHLIRLADLVDSYRDLLSGTTDAYLSVVSNQLNQVMKQLTIIATVFLPLSFLTGFFGQNFAWMVNHIGSWEAFVVVGLGTELFAVVALMSLFFRRGWLGSR